jgi:hypothetical protein
MNQPSSFPFSLYSMHADTYEGVWISKKKIYPPKELTTQNDYRLTKMDQIENL